MLSRGDNMKFGSALVLACMAAAFLSFAVVCGLLSVHYEETISIRAIRVCAVFFFLGYIFHHLARWGFNNVISRKLEEN